ncbi:hypothetical protein Stube_32260 [Streptomyces tubercidicus]|uniref:Uncharacterized protein n=1 Tax=Streptomyces tubercidicus TaxID=47759 RepID=A0A640UR90_9ACTN|nr:hypothetical protein Stube_32260 [Streptomyces tubercidicus]
MAGAPSACAPTASSSRSARCTDPIKVGWEEDSPFTIANANPQVRSQRGTGPGHGTNSRDRARLPGVR